MKKFYILALVAAMFAACATDATEDVAIGVPETLEVSFEEESRIQLQNGKTVWTEGDLVSVFYKSYENMKWKFAGKTGDRTGTLLKVSGSANEQTMDNVVVAYPYSDYYSISLSTGGLVAFLPAEQTYMADSYGVDGNIMVSQSEYKQFVLKSVCGWVKIQLTGNGEKVQSIKLKGNNGEQVAGEIYINTADATTTLASAIYSNFDNTEVGGTMLEDNTILTEVTLNCGEGVTLSAKPTAFYIALPPQEFSKGLTVEVEDTKGYVMKQSTDKVVTIERNHILPMASFEFNNPNIETTPKPANNEIWYTNRSTTQKTSPYETTDVFGANIVSNLYDAEKKCWVITFDGEVTSIGNWAFFDCTSLTSITIPDSVTEIGARAFYRCSSLTSITIPDSVTEIGGRAFYRCTSLTSVTIPDSVTSIGYYAFYECTSLTSVTIGDSVTKIGDYAFYHCPSLTSVTIGDSVTKIGDNAFYYCPSLKEVYYTGDLSAWCKINFNEDDSNPIYNGAKLYLNGVELTEATIPSNVTEIKDHTFYGCTSLTSVTIPDSVTEIGDYAFNRCTSLTSVTIGDSVTEIRSYAFSHCTSLTSVAIGDSVTEIGYFAFYRCISLTSVTIGDSVTKIVGSAFEDCTSLTSVTIGDSVTEIGYWAFRGCKSLTSVYCKPTTPPSGGDYMFNDNASGRKFYVPRASVDAYKAAQYWSSYESYIEPYDFE